MRLVLALLGALLPGVLGLLCNDCSSDSWDSCQIVNCPVYSRACTTVHQSQNLAGNISSSIWRSCTDSKTCYESFSFNNGYESMTKSSECCSSDLCNTGEPSVNKSANGLVCCAGVLPNCTHTVQCTGTEDHCFTASQHGGRDVIMGCLSKSVCDNPQLASPYLFSGSNVFSCCQGNYCNNLNTTIQCSNCTLQNLLLCPSGSPSCNSLFFTCTANVYHSESQTSPFHYFYTTCTSSATCNNTNSYFDGYYKQIQISACCSQGTCDLQRLTDNTFNTPNGLMCCIGPESTCDMTAECVGAEDSCFIEGRGTFYYKGCITKNACYNSIFYFSEFRYCCQGSLCNNIDSISTLTCNVCSSNSWDTCQNETTLCFPTSGQCASVSSFSSYNGMYLNSYVSRGCMSDLSCNMTASINTGYQNITSTSQCCNSSLCNTDQVTLNASSDPNGLLCCYGGGSTCQNVVTCTGNQDYCYTSDGLLSYYQGCASQSVCDNPAGASAFLQPYYFGTTISCCQGNFCNRLYKGLICNSCWTSYSGGQCGNSISQCGGLNSSCAAIIESNTMLRLSCVDSAVCNTSASINYGYGSNAQITQCCDSDLCNTKNITDNTMTVANGLLCCAGINGTCQQVVNCVGIEDHCFTAVGGYTTYQGCASTSVCDNSGSSNALNITFSSQITCCQGVLCNKPNSSLLCNSCLSPYSWNQCTSSITPCNSSLACVTMLRPASSWYSYSQTTFQRSCVTPDICNTSGSINYGYGSSTWISKCCNTDLCNTETVNASAELNGLVCCAGTNGNCQQVLNCTGMQDRCFTAYNGWNNYYQGCISKNFCENSTNANLITPIFGVSQINCCQGSLCNKPNNTIICHNCFSSYPWMSCTNSFSTCSPVGSSCGSVLSSQSYYGFIQSSFSLGCVISQNCNMSGSINYGFGTATWISQCCTSDLCNTQQVNVSSGPNGLVCCAGNSGSCQSTINCTDIQDHCFSADDGVNAYYGCSSRSVCDSPSNYSSILQIYFNSTYMSCCQGNLCNKPTHLLTCKGCSAYSLDTCQNTSNVCSSQWSQCATVVISNYNIYGEYQTFPVQKYCAPPSSCNISISFIDNPWTKSWSSKCCNSDLCDSNVNVAPSALQCCSGNDASCQRTVSCMTDQDFCFTLDAGYNVYRGCASQSVCENPGNAATYFQNVVPVPSGSQLDCCQGLYCNKPNSTFICQSCLASSWDLCGSGYIACDSHSSACATILESNYIYWNSMAWFSRSCSPLASCNMSTSINFGGGSYTRISTCCSSDACNMDNVTVSNLPNGLKCCWGGNCQNSVSCTGIQDYCFTSDNGYQGCASSSVCANSSYVAEVLNLNLGLKIDCCQGFLCNKNYSGLSCNVCISPLSWSQCVSSVSNCDQAGATCVTLLQTRSDNYNSIMYSRSCGTPAGCNLTGSVDYSDGRRIWMSKCCSSDFCNTDDVLDSTEPNGLQCCAGIGGSCPNLINCVGIDDLCFLSGKSGLTCHSGNLRPLAKRLIAIQRRICCFKKS
ncbi:uncharacterized protein LOC120517567 [Polypterus senegalus]|uniref:uncharacterized protein LOC120517567 n=1 Tax=Polypterus senegalus TaxID=55291 RepID=UPI001965F23E|nr:uncharacterized protein LOC120517567 [Polypterus senegalus]